MSDEPASALLEAVRACERGRALGHVWTLIERGVECGWVEDVELAMLIQNLARGRDYGIEELLFDPHLEEGRTRVSFLDDDDDCSTEALLEVLRALSQATTDLRPA